MRLQSRHRHRLRLRSGVGLFLAFAVVALMPDVTGSAARLGAQTPASPLEQPEPRPAPQRDTDDHGPHPLHEIDDAMIRLPLSALLGAALALRPKRRGTPPRTAPVVQTQIILAVVGAVIMLVVGASLARAFAIVGAANLIR
jgi:hypothetical protein